MHYQDRQYNTELPGLSDSQREIMLFPETWYNEAKHARSRFNPAAARL